MIHEETIKKLSELVRLVLYSLETLNFKERGGCERAFERTDPGI
jgi:hypothetical protein